MAKKKALRRRQRRAKKAVKAVAHFDTTVMDELDRTTADVISASGGDWSQWKYGWTRSIPLTESEVD